MDKSYHDQSDRLNERKLTIKRRYTENHPAREVGKAARVRNTILEAIADGKITQEEFDKIVSELSSDSKRWLKRNSEYFNVSEDGITLSKSGSRIFKQLKTNTQPTMRKLVMESFREFINANSVNENTEAINEGTRGQFGIIDKKGNIESIYTHYDSYPEYSLPIIKKHYKNAKAVKAVVAQGGSSGLDAPNKMDFYNDGTDPIKGKVSNLDSYLRFAANDGGAEYIYLYDESDKKWYMIDVYGDRKLVPAFESLEISEESETEMVAEAFKSSKLRNLMNMDQSSAYGKQKNLASAFYGMSKVKLDKVGDESLVDVDPKTAYKQYANNKDFVVFYIVDNEKENPYSDEGGRYSLKPGILALSRSKDFLSVSYDQRRTKNHKNAKYTLSKDTGSAVGGNKNYKGYGATGISSIKRAAELADRAIVFNLVAGSPSSTDDIAARIEAKEGAIAFKSAKDFKDANRKRYQEILAAKAAALPLDKMVEDAINQLTAQMQAGIKSGEKTQYGEIKVGQNSKGRDVKVTDVANHMNSILRDYERYVSYIAQAEKEKEDGYSSGYYERESKNYAKSLKDGVKKIKKFDYAW